MMLIRVMRNAIWLLRHPGFAKLFYSLLLDLLMVEPVGAVDVKIRARLMRKMWALIKAVKEAKQH